mgnify:FL=1
MFRKSWMKHIRTIVAEGETGGDSENTAEQAGESPKDEPQRTFTQDKVNELVERRLARERAKQGDIAELRRKAKLYDEAEEASKTEAQKLTEQNQKQAARIAQLEHGKLVSDACMAHGIPAEYADLVTGADEEAVNASAAKVAKLIGGAAKHATEPPAVTVPSEGTRPAASGSKTIYELIAAAEKNGDAAKAIALKSMLLADKN